MSTWVLNQFPDISAINLGSDEPLLGNTNTYRNVSTLVGRNVSLECPVREKDNNKVI